MDLQKALSKRSGLEERTLVLVVNFVSCGLDTCLHSVGQLESDAANIFVRLWTFFLLDRFSSKIGVSVKKRPVINRDRCLQ